MSPTKVCNLACCSPHPLLVNPKLKWTTLYQSEEREIPEGALKYTCRRYNLGIDTREGEEILDPEIKIPEESDFYCTTFVVGFQARK